MHVCLPSSYSFSHFSNCLSDPQKRRRRKKNPKAINKYKTKKTVFANRIFCRFFARLLSSTRGLIFISSSILLCFLSPINHFHRTGKFSYKPGNVFRAARKHFHRPKKLSYRPGNIFYRAKKHFHSPRKLSYGPGNVFHRPGNFYLPNRQNLFNILKPVFRCKKANKRIDMLKST